MATYRMEIPASFMIDIEADSEDEAMTIANAFCDVHSGGMVIPQDSWPGDPREGSIPKDTVVYLMGNSPDGVSSEIGIADINDDDE